jgi:hypothetical protein
LAAPMILHCQIGPDSLIGCGAQRLILSPNWLRIAAPSHRAHEHS